MSGFSRHNHYKPKTLGERADDWISAILLVLVMVAIFAALGLIPGRPPSDREFHPRLIVPGADR